VEDLKYLGTTLTNQNSIQEEIMSRLKSGRGEVYTEFWWGNLRERNHLEEPGLDGRIILRWILGKWGHGLDRAGSELGQVAGPCECGNEPWGSIKCGEFLD